MHPLPCPLPDYREREGANQFVVAFEASARNITFTLAAPGCGSGRHLKVCEGRKMQLRTFLASCACAGAVGLICADANAQLVFGTTTPTTTNPCAIYLDVTTGVTTTLWNSASNKKVN